MGRTTQTVLELQAGSLAESDLIVRRVAGREILSRPYSFEIDFHPVNGEPLTLGDLAGADALVTLRRPDGSERHVHGMLSAVEMTGVASKMPLYRASVVPGLDRLRHIRRSRVFQGMSAPEVVKQVLDEGNVKHRLSLAGSHPVREYCVQYRESDLDFINRLLEDEGIFYWFEHSTTEHVMVVADDAGGCTQLPGKSTVPFRVPVQIGDAAEDEHLFSLEQVHRVRAGKVALKDFDFERPALSVSASSSDSGDKLGLEHYEYPGGFRDPGAGSPISKLRLEELRFGVENFEGEGTCLRFVPGATFEVADHPDASFNKKVLLVRVDHEATQQGGPGEPEAIEHGYRNTFLALDADVPYRPRRRTRRAIASAETATVVGPGREEIHPDLHGAVKVQFHWDREGQHNESSSCWIRVAQGWAGSGWGASFIPRMGQEVLVRFLEGDPDRPLVMGAIYNGANPPPVTLPGEKTKSTLRTDSSPGSGGANELRLEDLKDAEEIHLHAQKDEKIEVLNDKAQKVSHDEALEVVKDRTIEVQGYQQLAVAQSEVSVIEGSQTLAVSAKRRTSVGGSHTEEVASLQSSSVGGNKLVTVATAGAESVGAAAALNVGGGLAINVAGVMNKAVGGLFSGQVGGAHIEAVGASRDEQVGKNSVASVGTDFRIDVKGQVSLTTGTDQQEDVDGKLGIDVTQPVSWLSKEIRLETDELSVIVDGKLALSMKSGNVTFGASSLTVDGSTLKLKGSAVKKVASAQASQKMAQVAQLEALRSAKGIAKVSLSGADGKPVAGVRLKAELPDGTVVHVRTDGSGDAAIPSGKEGEVKISLPDIDGGS